jgi:hypothetical protein
MRESIEGASSPQNLYRMTVRAGDFGYGVHIILSKALRTEASLQLLIARITTAELIPPSPQCMARLQGYQRAP